MNANVNKTNGVKLFALVAVLAMVVAGAAMVFSEESTAATDDNTQIYGGQTLTTVQTFDGVNIQVVQDLTISGAGDLRILNGNLIINEGVTVTLENGGKITITGGLVTINGNVVVDGRDGTAKASFNISAPGDTTGKEPYEDYGVVLNGTVTVKNGGSMIGTNGGSILINDGGNLAITSSGSRISSITGLNVEIATGGTFRLDGTSGSTGETMTVTSCGSGTNKTTARVTITSGAADGNTTSDLTFTTTSSTYTAYKTATDSVMMREYALNVNGTVDKNDRLTFTSISSTAYTYTSEDAAKSNGMYTYNDMVVGKVIVNELNVKGTASVDVSSNSYIVVTGTMEFSPSTTNNAAPAANQVIQGTIELQGTLKGDIRAFYTQKIDPKGTIAINGGEAIFTHYNEDVYGSTVKVYGAMWQDDDDDSTVYITDLASALADASAAGITEVMVVGLNGCSDRSNEVRGSYVVDSDITLPADMNLSVNCGLIINEGVSMTIPSTAGISFEGTWSIVYVNGKLIDYDTISQTTALSKIGFEVMSSVESGEDVINTYTSFATALSETTEGTIYLYDNIVIDRNMTIPENVTVQYADVKGVTGTISFKPDTKYTFTVDGTLFLTNGHNFVTTGGTVVVNNVIKFDDLTTVGSADGTPEVNGAYFTATLGDDADPYAYITSVAFAAENSSSIDNTNSDDNIIAIFGNVAMGNATFTLGADVQSLTVAIYNNGNDKATGDITLVGNVTFSTAGSNNYEGTFDGTITTDVSAGNVVIDLDNVNDVIIKVVSTEGADGTVTSVEMFSNTENQNVNQIDGTVTIESGEVTIPTKTMVDKLVVSQSATLNVDADLVVVVNPNYKFNTTSSSLPVFTEEFIANAAGLVVDGNMVIDKNANVEAIIAHVGGTVTVTDGFFYAYLSCVDGTIAAAEDGSSQLAVALLNGTVSGDAVFEAVIAFPGSDITGADVTAPNSADIQSTVIYVNGAEFGTYYAKDGVAIESVLLAMDVDGVKIDTADFCTDADMRNSFTDLTSTEDADILTDLDDVIKAVQGIKDTASLNNVKTKLNSIEGTSVGTYTEVYIGMEPADVTGTITVYEGMNLYIDGQAISNFMKQVGDKYVYVLPVGTHQFSVQVDPGFTGTPVVTLDGQTVTGSFTISNDAQSFQIVVTGDIAQDIPTTGSSDDGMGLTDYLLIILVVLIVIMAIMVAMRLMRS